MSASVSALTVAVALGSAVVAGILVTGAAAYRRRRTRWNHMRTLAAAVASALWLASVG